MLVSSVAVMYGTDAGEDTADVAGLDALPEAEALAEVMAELLAEEVAEALLDEELELVATAQYLSLDHPLTTPAMY
jgi:hypothetical protein